MTHIHHIALGVAITTLLVGCEANVEPAESGGSGPGGASAPGQSTSAGGAKQTGTVTWMSGGVVQSTSSMPSNGGVMQSTTASTSSGGVMQSATSTSKGGGATTTVQCAAVPVCDPGDTEITGACPPDLSCYTRTLCGSTINCKRAPTDCEPETEYNRNYVADAEGCKVVKFACQTNTTMFSNACGCGCEQDSTCPEFVDCMPGLGTRSPLCSNTSCPFTTRAL